ncbi:MAG: LD-carboxypeptidase [Acidobacteriaceae bacterium]|nr:LD-carboxypeptidase [Acidobacteriaceae bacterium]
MLSNPASARVKPAALRPGDTIGIVAPASNIKPELLQAGCEALTRLDYKPFYFDSILEQDLYFAGSVERRARELEEMFRRPEVRAIICARGGYGTNYLLPALDIDLIKAHPKIFVGYSDVTTLLTYFADAAGLVTFHGPMVTKDFAHVEGVDSFSWGIAVSGGCDWTFPPSSQPAVRALVDGAAQGILYGGCLSMLAASLGTPYEIHTGGTILFIEDVATKPFQIDRMLMQLKLAGKLEGVRGIIFGEMLDCVQNQDQGYSLDEVIVRVVGDLGVPIAIGLRSGHVSKENVTLPIGVLAELQVSGTRIDFRLLEPASIATPSSQVTRARV